MSFSPGDPVWCRVDPGHSHLGNAGELPAVIAKHGFMAGWWIVDIDGVRWAAPNHYLRPRNPPAPTREELGEWDLCPWRPERQPETVSGEQK